MVIGAFLCSGLLVSCGLIPPPSPGSISAVSPAEGTVGTELTISGSNLGAQPGEVFVGTAKAEVSQWNANEIVCRLTEPLAPGDYDVKVQPWWPGSAVATCSCFSVRAAWLAPLSFRPQFLAGGETLTLTGKFLGTQKGEVALVHRDARRAVAEVQDWTPTAVTIVVPAGLTGLWNLELVNGVGTATEPSWCTFEPSPAGAPQPLTYSPATHSHDNATGIYFDGALWVFNPAPSSDYGVRCDKYVNGAWADAPDLPGNSQTQSMPLVIEGVLWLFNTATKNGQDGQIQYSRYNPASNSWSEFVNIPGATTNVAFEAAAAYNCVPPYHRIEVFYNSGGGIYRVYSDDYGDHWSNAGWIASANGAPSAMFWEKAVYWDSGEHTSHQLDFATLVGYTIGNGWEVAYVQDGAVQHKATTTGNYYVALERPFLVDLDADYLAALYQDGDCQPTVLKMDKATGQWQTPYRALSTTTDCWNPTGVVGYQSVADANSHSGYRYDAMFYLFWGKPAGLYTDWAMSALEYLGYYIEASPPVYGDLAAQMSDTFYLWPVLGVVDAPPFVMNGVDPNDAGWDCHPETECTRAEFETSLQTSLDQKLSASVGAYVQTGEHNPLKLELSGEVNAEISVTKDMTQGRSDTLLKSSAGKMLIYYLTPVFNTHTYEWFNHSGQPTGDYFYVEELLGLNTTCLPYDPTRPGSPCPDCNMPATDYFGGRVQYHAYAADIDRLNSYNTPPSTSYPALFQNQGGDWSDGVPGSLYWDYQAVSTGEVGLKIDFSIGAANKWIGGGVTGSFAMQVTVGTAVAASTHTYLENPDASHSGDVYHFHVDGYWLSPNASGYWVPANRANMGDAPWFVTYYVPPSTIQTE
jgi:hypothetical protein